MKCSSQTAAHCHSEQQDVFNADCSVKLTDGVQVGRCRPSAGGRVQTASRGHSSSYMSYINHLETFVGGQGLLIFLTLKFCAVFCKLCVTNLIHVCVTH